MKTSPVSKADLERSVISVPPLARNRDLTVSVNENLKLIRYLEAAGVSTLMYGGNANVYNMGVFDYVETMQVVAELAAADTWVIPSIGPDFGKAMDQAKILRDSTFPTCMILPLNFPATPAGATHGIAAIANRFGRPIIAYIKAENYLQPKDVGALARAGLLCGIKYAVVRENPSQDGYLKQLLDEAGSDIVISGIGERPAIDHLSGFGLPGFTSGSVCIAPSLSTALLAALKRKDYVKAREIRAMFLPLEDLRDAISQLRVLHEAVTLTGIADMGPQLPMLSNIEDAAQLRAIEVAARALRQRDDGVAHKAA